VTGEDLAGGPHPIPGTLTPLALVTAAGPYTGDVAAPCPALASPPNPTAAEPGDG